jgi:tRNA nucleotidyltransferase (CCA-adding enzyme)
MSATISGNTMEIFKVGGAVRDELLGLAPTEFDWVVVGATPEQMRELGYRRVGRDFPVFLHPETNEEYALARTERKVGARHTDFVCDAGPDVTLEDDLARRDLTINAIAQAADGTLIDPWSGRRDLDNRVLRHVSDAFAEDPLRVFRVARFAAQLGPFGFEVAPETMALMTTMARRGDLDALSAERVWQELRKTLATTQPQRFFEVLDACNGLADWFPELRDRVAMVSRLWQRTAQQLAESLLRFAALGWLLDTGDVERFCTRLKAPNDFRQLALACASIGPALANWRAHDGAALLALGKQAGMLRQPDVFTRLLDVIAACSGNDLAPLAEAAARARAVTSEPLIAKGIEGPALGRALDTERARVLDDARQR